MRVGAEQFLLSLGRRVGLLGHVPLQGDDRQVHGQRGQHRAARAPGGPAQGACAKQHDSGRVLAVRETVKRKAAVVLPDTHEQRGLDMAVDQGDVFVGMRLELRRTHTALGDVAHQAVQGPGLLFPVVEQRRRALGVLVRGAGTGPRFPHRLHVVVLDAGTPLEQGLQLALVRHGLALAQQQPAQAVQYAEGQRLPQLDQVAHLGQRDSTRFSAHADRWVTVATPRAVPR